MSIGATLQQERQRQGISLDAVAAHTRISHRFLQAIETDEFDQLPGTVFARNFVRQYALALDLNPADLLAQMPTVDIEAIPLPDVAQFARPQFHKSRWASALSSVVWVGMAAGTCAGAWLYFYHNQAGERRLANSPSPHALAPGSASQTEQSAESASVGAAAANPASDTPRDGSVSPLMEGTPAASMGAHAVQVLLTAREASWVQVIADGRNAFTGILNPNDSRTVGAESLVKVTAGNAGGLEISLNGKALDPLGASGQVRTIRLTAEGPEQVRSSPPL